MHATAAVINDPPAIGHSVIVFPQRDFVFGVFAVDANLKVEVWRGAVQVGVSDPFVNSDPAGFNLNHLGAPCWATVTPDIIPGDMVQVVNLDTGETDRTTTANVVVTQNATAAGNTVVMKGTAAQADGTQFPISQLDARIVASTKDPFSDGTRTIRVQPVYDTATGSAWTATFSQTKNATPLTAADVALAVQSESRINWLGRLVGGAAPRESTIYESLPAGGPTGGPAAGCSAPRASDAVTATTPAAVKHPAVQAGGNMVLSGTSFNAASGTVSLTDGVTPIAVPVTLSAVASTDPAVPLPGSQTWTASIPMTSVAGLTDGTLTASAKFTRVLTTTHPDPVDPTIQVRDTGVIAGASRTLLKDVVAPQPPTASPAGGTYFAAQSVNVAAAVPALETVRYTIASPTAPDPTQSSPAVSGQISVTASQQVKAVSFDPVGNPSTVLMNDYVIRTPSVPGAPTAVSATPRNALATASWTAPIDTAGSPINNYRVDVFQGGLMPPALGQDAGAGTTWNVGGLTNGVAYQFKVRAQNSTPGMSTFSAPSPAVTPLAPPTVTARAPADNVTKVSQASVISATFSHAVTGVNGSTFTLQNAATHAVVAATVGTGTTNQWILHPTSPLAANTRYTATLLGGASSAIRDLAGNALVGSSWSFATGPGPLVIGRSPALNATKVSPATAVTATFSEAMNGITASTFTLRKTATNVGVLASVSRNSTTNQWILRPSAPLTANTRYTATLLGGASSIRDLAGNPLVGSSWSFATGPGPLVIGRSPAVNAINVSRLANVTVRFSEPVLGVSATTWVLRNAVTHAVISAVRAKQVS